MELRIHTDELQQAISEALAEALGDHFDLTRPLAVDEEKAAELLCLAAYQLADLRRRGLVHGVKAGRSYRYSKKALLDFLNKDDAG